jgi:hypothetical protein
MLHTYQRKTQRIQGSREQSALGNACFISRTGHRSHCDNQKASEYKTMNFQETFHHF